MNVEEPGNEQRQDEFSSGSLAGSIASGSSGFGSLPKKRPALLSSGESNNNRQSCLKSINRLFIIFNRYRSKIVYLIGV